MLTVERWDCICLTSVLGSVLILQYLLSYADSIEKWDCICLTSVLGSVLILEYLLSYADSRKMRLYSVLYMSHICPWHFALPMHCTECTPPLFYFSSFYFSLFTFLISLSFLSRLFPFLSLLFFIVSCSNFYIVTAVHKQ